ncbi:MAG: tryptophan--tRNA ligase [Verrucomicrobiia bacterium]|jgi:tryptophanyl-tRNA synthetase
MRILSGIQPSGKLHIGNYFGMMRPALELAQRGEAFYFIADYHALTSISDPDELRANVLDVALDFLACGLDPGRTVFYRQSDVPQVTELTWILSNVTPVPMLENAHSYKDKIAQGLKPNAGLFTYPVLMAADILIVQGERVPVGKDQKQHVEMTRDIAGAFNRQFGEVFVIPDAVIRPEVATLPGVDGRKMSKSYNNTIEIFGDEKAIRKKVMSIVTDSQPVEAPKADLDKNIPLELYYVVATALREREGATPVSKESVYTNWYDRAKADLAARSPMDPSVKRNVYERYLDNLRRIEAGGHGYGDLKKELLAALMDYFAPFRKKREELVKNLDYVHDVLRKGAEQANAVADETMSKVRKAVGLR